MKKIITSGVLLAVTTVLMAQTSPSAKELVSKMTLEEKVNLVVGMGMKIPGMTEGSGTGVGQTMDKVPGAAGTTFAIQRLICQQLL